MVVFRVNTIIRGVLTTLILSTHTGLSAAVAVVVVAVVVVVDTVAVPVAQPVSVACGTGRHAIYDRRYKAGRQA